ncbi:MAG TPA: xanthine dehydrogenase family protein subunit M [Acidimicrobiales bacterium]|nr:xanthine dehydrogenase family protein subunit M [Acidimicrobiales bacterium]
MYPARFDYLAPTSVEEALSALAERGDDAKVLAGGQSLIPLMKLRLAAPAMLIDINRLPGMAFIEPADGHLRIGALARHNDLADSDVVRRANHTMAAAAPWIADPLVRNLGTIGGSLAHADPQGDWGSVMLACGGEVVARSTAGERVIPIGEFLLGVFTTALRPDELLTEIRVPRYGGPAGGTYLKLERKVGDYATVGVAIHLQLDDQRQRITQAGIGLTAVAPGNLKATVAEETLIGQPPGEQLFADAANLAAQAAEPRTDVRGSAEYKRDVVRVFVQRGLARAMELAASA